MVPVLLIVIPLVCGAFTFFLKSEGAAKTAALLASIATLVVTLLGLTTLNNQESLFANADWMPLLGSSFAVGIDGMGQILCLLTAIAFPVIFVSTWNSKYSNAHNFFALMLLSQAGLMGVFVAYDALLFYFFWELALIPAYFLCSQWGGERRIPVTFKFFIYTFVGSLFMLVGIIYLYSKTPDRSFSLESFYNLSLTGKEQMWLFWIMFVAFAVKMPIFPFHTWQPDTYEQSPTAVTMVLSGVMVKMGVFAVLRWLIPVLPMGSWAWGDTVSTLAIIGMIYASLIAMRQDDIKRLIAYSSIAHIGLMCLAIFATNTMSMQGVMIQMFNHGINIIGMWIVVELIERQFKTRKMSELGGLAQKAPTLAILLVIVALANVALPLTNAFVGEFLMFAGVFNSDVTEYSKIFTVAAAITIILSAVYTLNMLQKVLFGNTSAVTSAATDIRGNEKLILGVLVVVILVFGIYPKPMLEVTQSTVDLILSKMINKHPL
ncbi:MAG: NADH-quinone oxidoreductase subunit M [Chitinophagaceae bacterium]|nr:MAG: NADH-quinone oxidoreductase subunit M [Chitinophagaceae bacterium]